MTLRGPGPVARVRRTFAVGDEIVLELPVGPRLTAPDDRVDAVRGCLAVEKGPVVLCLESTDLPDGLQVDDVRLDPSVTVAEDGTGAVGRGVRVRRDEWAWPYRDASSAGPETGAAFPLRLVPYHSWANRGPSTMRVWLPVG